MRLPKNDIPVRIDAPGATARQLPDFGTPSGDPRRRVLLARRPARTSHRCSSGLEDDACQAPHWGYLLDGRVVVTYTDGSSETCTGGDVFHWPAGHSVRVEQDAEVILFSPQDEHGPVLDHMRERMGL